jgi:hypothetical protein
VQNPDAECFYRLPVRLKPFSVFLFSISGHDFPCNWS